MINQWQKVITDLRSRLGYRSDLKTLGNKWTEESYEAAYEIRENNTNRLTDEMADCLVVMAAVLETAGLNFEEVLFHAESKLLKRAMDTED